MVSPNGTDALPEEMDIDEEVLYVELTDEMYEELAELEGSTLEGVTFWDDSLADDLEEEAPVDSERTTLDVDIHLEDGVLLELFGVMLYESPEAGPLVGLARLERALKNLVDNECVLDSVAETEDRGLVLIFATDDEVMLYIAAGAWTVGEWEAEDWEE